MGVNQGHEATRTAQAIINLALMTGNIGRPGTGANSITGQCNAMGSRLVLEHDQPARRPRLSQPEPIARKIAGVLGHPRARDSAARLVAYDQIVDGIADGAIKGLW